MQIYNKDEGLDSDAVSFIRSTIKYLTHLMQVCSLVFGQSESNTFVVFQARHLSRCGTWHTSRCHASLPMLSEDLLSLVTHARVWVVSRLKICVEQCLSPTIHLAYQNNQLLRWKERTASISRASKTRAQSRLVNLKALHGIFLKMRPSRRTVVIGPYNRSADEVKRSIAYK
jgi:hypothetical protein